MQTDSSKLHLDQVENVSSRASGRRWWGEERDGGNRGWNRGNGRKRGERRQAHPWDRQPGRHGQAGGKRRQSPGPRKRWEGWLRQRWDINIGQRWHVWYERQVWDIGSRGVRLSCRLHEMTSC